MKARVAWPRILAIPGGIAMLAGALDPLEGSVIIVAGSGLVALSTFLGDTRRGLRVYWICVFTLIAVGVGAMFALSAMGGVGGRTGRSSWWALPVLPYPVGWIMGMVSLVARLIRSIRDGHAVG